MVRAKEEGFPPDAKGFKTLLVLTDGADNRFDNDTALHARHGTKDLQTFLQKEFNKLGVVINFVGFKVVAAQIQALQQQFKNTIEEVMDPKGSYYTTDNVDELTRKLPAGTRS